MNQHAARNKVMVCALAANLVGLAVHAADTSHDFTRYKTIIDRLPFGAMAGTGPEIPQPSFAAHYTFVGLVKEDDTQPLLAIIFDKDGNQTYFKAEGDKVGVGDTTVVKIEKADKGQVKLVLKQGLEVATLFLETKAGVGAAPPPPGAQPQPAIPGQSPGPIPPQPGVRRIPFRRGG